MTVSLESLDGHKGGNILPKENTGLVALKDVDDIFTVTQYM